MKKFAYLCICVAATCLFASFTGKPKEKGETVYLFGFSASFSDSLVYFTDVQMIEGLQVEKKTKFLTNESGYTQQLKEYLEGTVGAKNRTCVTFHSTSKEKLQKKYLKLRKKYSDMNMLTVKDLNEQEFKYQKIEDENEDEHVEE